MLRGRCNPLNADGIIRHTYHLAHAQLSLGHDVEVYGIASKAHEPELIDRDGLLVRAFPRTLSPFGVHAALSELISGSGADADIIHIQPPHDPAAHGLATLLRRRGLPYMLSAHAMWSPVALTRHRLRKRLYKLLFDDRMVGASVGVHATSVAEVAEIRQYAPSARVFVIRNAIVPPPAEALREAGPKYWEHYFGDYPAEARVFAFLGRLDPFQKGLDLLLEAWAIAAERSAHPLLLALIGPSWRGSESSLREDVARLGLGSNVAFVGPLYDAEKYVALGSADCYVQTSRYEGSPYSVKEALACGIPAILTPATNLAETVERYGAGVCVPLDVAAIARAVEGIAVRSAADLSAMGANARRLIEERHSLPAAARKMVSAYEAALSGEPFADDD